MRAKERILARKSRGLHIVWHFPNTSKGPMRVINENKGSVVPGASELYLLPRSSCKEDKKGGPARRVNPQPTSTPGGVNQWACVLEMKQD